MSIELKIKARVLASEARIIRRYEQKARAARNKANRSDAKERAANYSAQMALLRSHRVDVVRKAARSTHLARGFLKGHHYLDIERKAHQPPDWEGIAKMVVKYGEERFHNVTWRAIVDWANVNVHDSYPDEFDS